mgnify:FL=1|tara:strand:+ start:473 stop:685 length:213 start_codon:yes stop_codon:yes gene_type:complete
MFALLQNELILYTIIVVMVLAFIIGKFVGFKKFFGYFRSSGDRVTAAKVKTAPTAPAKATKAAKAAEATD